MYRYRMVSKPRRYGWLVAAVIIGLLLIILLSSHGGQQATSGSLPSVSEYEGGSGIGGTLTQLWGDLKAGAVSLWQGLTGQSGAKQLDISLDDPEEENGSGDDGEDPVSGDVQVVSSTPQPPSAFVPAGASPQVLIYHTHSYESYDKLPGQNYLETAQWRTKDNAFNIAAVGEALAQQLSSKYGIAALHDETDNECSQLGTAYSRSLTTVQKDMADNPGLKILIDLHRDAYSAGINPHTVTVNGKQAARVMIVIGTGAGQTGVGFSQKPDWQKNMKLAQAITDRLNQFDPQFTRKVDVKTGRYNQHVSTGAILIEVGDNKNTLDQALATVPFLAQAIADVYNGMTSAATASPSASPTPTPSPSASPSQSYTTPAAPASPAASPSATVAASPSPSPSGPLQQVIALDPLTGTQPPDNNKPR